jgi:hypothetical protein
MLGKQWPRRTRVGNHGGFDSNPSRCAWPELGSDEYFCCGTSYELSHLCCSIWRGQMLGQWLPRGPGQRKLCGSVFTYNSHWAWRWLGKWDGESRCERASYLRPVCLWGPQVLGGKLERRSRRWQYNFVLYADGCFRNAGGHS